MSVAALRPEHISAYSLQIEEGTQFYEKMNSGYPLAIPNEDDEREIYHCTKEILEKFGYERYEISNYALPGRECRHNCGYWTRQNYLGIGLGSSSMVDNVRWKNIEDLNEYISLMGGETGNVPDGLRTEVEKISHKEQMEEYMFLGLRMMRGITKEDFFETFKTDYDFVYGIITDELMNDGLLVTVETEKEDENSYAPVTETRVFLTEKGIDVSNRVLAEFLQDDPS